MALVDRRPVGAQQRFYCAAAHAVGILLGLACLTCAACAPDASSTNQRYSEDSFPQDLVLTEQDQKAVLDAMAGTATGAHASSPRAARTGMRWSDVPAALHTAAVNCMLGLAELKPAAGNVESSDEITATLVEPDGQRGQAVVIRGATDFTVRVSLGTFGQPKEEAAFIAAFEAELRRLGTLKRF